MFVCCDLEGTCWEREPMRTRQRSETEIIEIGAVKLSPDRDVIDEFQTYARPQRHPQLSDFCRALTGITQTQVDTAPSLLEALTAFSAWIGDPNAVLISWGPWDREQLQRASRAWNINPPADLSLHIDAKEEFSAWSKAHRRSRHGRGLRAAVEELGFTFSGDHHSALDDARNLARVFARIRDPSDISPEAAFLMSLLNARGAAGTHIGHMRSYVSLHPQDTSTLSAPRPQQWWSRAASELIRVGLATALPNGKGLVPRAAAQSPKTPPT